MMEPYLKVVKGYTQVMPSFRGQLSAPEAAALVEFIKSLRSDSLENCLRRNPFYGPQSSVAEVAEPPVRPR
jgi:cytochrome c oxidase subunit 2